MIQSLIQNGNAFEYQGKGKQTLNVLDGANQVAADLYHKVLKRGDLDKPFLIGYDVYAKAIGMDAGFCRICVQYLNGKGYIKIEPKLDSISVTVLSALIDLVESQQ